MTGQILAALWELAAVSFLVGVAVTVRKARARGQRLFRDEPLARVRALKHDTTHLHEMDAL